MTSDVRTITGGISTEGLPDSDVSVIILSIGEPYTERALASVRAQTLPPREIVFVEGVSPFSRAINTGARQVRTPFFVQVDADMVLDPSCLDTLRRHVRPDSGIVVAELRDPLEGQVVGVKLFRTSCFDAGGMPDTVAQDTDFVAALGRRGWQTHYLHSGGGDETESRPTLGEHRPDYTPAYTYRKLLRAGARLRHRAARHGLCWQFDVLEQSGHPLALLAQVALGHGFFEPFERDDLAIAADHEHPARLLDLLAGQARLDDVAARVAPPVAARLGDIYRTSLDAGRQLAHARAGRTFAELFNALTGARRNRRALVAKVALAHGLLLDKTSPGSLERDERMFRDFVMHSLGSRSGTWDRLRAHVRQWVPRVGERNAIPW